MPQTKWFERKFDFSSTQNIFPSIVERLRGTPARLEEKIKSLPPHILTIKLDGSWSIAENIGHITDSELISQERLGDIIKGEKEFRPVDMQNIKTVDYNSKPISELLTSFRTVRTETVKMLEELDDEIVFRSALHPRLKIPLRTMDLFLITAEHDDHHLARMTEIAKSVSKQ
jgi:hypothetical protein